MENPRIDFGSDLAVIAANLLIVSGDFVEPEGFEPSSKHGIR